MPRALSSLVPEAIWAPDASLRRHNSASSSYDTVISVEGSNCKFVIANSIEALPLFAVFWVTETPLTANISPPLTFSSVIPIRCCAFTSRVTFTASWFNELNVSSTDP